MSVLTVLMLGLTTGCQEKNNDTGFLADPVNGAFVYNNSCSSCHGAEGLGATGPNLTTGLVRTKTDDELKTIVNDGVGSMPGDLVATDADLNDLIAYLRQQFD